MGFRATYNGKTYRNREAWEAAIAADRGPNAAVGDRKFFTREGLMSRLQAKAPAAAAKFQAYFDKNPLPGSASNPATPATPTPATSARPAKPKVVPASNKWSDIVAAHFPKQMKAGGLVKGGKARGYGCAQRGMKHSKKMG